MPEKELPEQEKDAEKGRRGIGQEILGDLEIIGGMLTGDPLTTAEGKFNVSVGEERRESSEALKGEDEKE